MDGMTRGTGGGGGRTNTDNARCMFANQISRACRYAYARPATSNTFSEWKMDAKNSRNVVELSWMTKRGGVSEILAMDEDRGGGSGLKI